MLTQVPDNAKMVVIVVLTVALSTLITFFRLMTGSWILALLIVGGLLYYLICTVGTFMMYPGAFAYTRSALQSTTSKVSKNSVLNFMNSFEYITMRIVDKQIIMIGNQDITSAILQHPRSIIDCLSLFENTLSQKKALFLDLYRHLHHHLNENYEGTGHNVYYLIEKNMDCKLLLEDQHIFFEKISKPILNAIAGIRQVVGIFIENPEAGRIEQIRNLFEQKFHEVRFAFQYWIKLYHFQINLIRSEGEVIETAIIYGHKSEDGDKRKEKAVMFCNPNGVYLQYFAIDNVYVNGYLRLGYNIILWNYRGYGQSTGTPSICNSQSDSLTVHNYYESRGQNITNVHGFSIGGAASIGMVHALEADKKGKISRLIIDRSFCGIGEIAAGLGGAIHFIASLIFHSDNINIAQLFYELNCNKTVLWDPNDEIISHRASLKGGLLSIELSQIESNSMYAFDQDTEAGRLAPKTTTLDLETITTRLQSAILLIINEKAQTIEERTRCPLVEEINSENERINVLIDLLKNLDGGGFYFWKKIDKLHHLNIEELARDCRYFVYGLALYGACLPLKMSRKIKNSGQVKNFTLTKIRTLLNNMVSKLEVKPQNQSNPIKNLFQSIYHIFSQLQGFISRNYGETTLAKYGSLLPTSGGHNGGLNRLEWFVLSRCIVDSDSDLPEETEEETEETIQTDSMS